MQEDFKSSVYIKGTGKRTYNCKFPKENTQKQGRSWAKTQEEICLEFSQAEGDCKVTPDKYMN